MLTVSKNRYSGDSSVGRASGVFVAPHLGYAASEMDKSNEYLHSLLEPYQSSPTLHPSLSACARMPKSVTFNKTFSPTDIDAKNPPTSLLILFQPQVRNLDNVLQIWASTDTGFKFWKAVLPDQSLGRDFRLVSYVSGAASVESNMVSASLASLQGEVTSILTKDTLKLSTLDSSTLPSLRQSDADYQTAVRLSDGVVVVADPNCAPVLYSPESASIIPTGPADLNLYYVYGNGQNLSVTTVDSPEWKFVTVSPGNANIFDTDRAPEDLPNSLFGHTIVDVSLAATPQPFGAQADNPDFYVIATFTRDGKDDFQVVRIPAVYTEVKAVAGGLMVSGSAHFYTPSPITRIQMTVYENLSIGNAYPFEWQTNYVNATASLRNWNFGNDGLSGNYALMIVEGYDTSDKISVDAKVNYEVVPNADLGRNIKLYDYGASAKVADADFARMVLDNKLQAGIRGVYRKTDYYAKMTEGYFRELSIRDAHYGLASDWVSGIKSVFRKVRSFAEPALKAFAPIAGKLAMSAARELLGPSGYASDKKVRLSFDEDDVVDFSPEVPSVADSPRKPSPVKYTVMHHDGDDSPDIGALAASHAKIPKPARILRPAPTPPVLQAPVAEPVEPVRAASPPPPRPPSPILPRSKTEIKVPVEDREVKSPVATYSDIRAQPKKLNLFKRLAAAVPPESLKLYNFDTKSLESEGSSFVTGDSRFLAVLQMVILHGKMCTCNASDSLLHHFWHAYPELRVNPDFALSPFDPKSSTRLPCGYRSSVFQWPAHVLDSVKTPFPCPRDVPASRARHKRRIHGEGLASDVPQPRLERCSGVGLAMDKPSSQGAPDLMSMMNQLLLSINSVKAAQDEQAKEIKALKSVVPVGDENGQEDDGFYEATEAGEHYEAISDLNNEEKKLLRELNNPKAAELHEDLKHDIKSAYAEVSSNGDVKQSEKFRADITSPPKQAPYVPPLNGERPPNLETVANWKNYVNIAHYNQVCFLAQSKFAGAARESVQYIDTNAVVSLAIFAIIDQATAEVTPGIICRSDRPFAKCWNYFSHVALTERLKELEDKVVYVGEETKLAIDSRLEDQDALRKFMDRFNSPVRSYITLVSNYRNVKEGSWHGAALATMFRVPCVSVISCSLNGGIDLGYDFKFGEVTEVLKKLTTIGMVEQRTRTPYKFILISSEGGNESMILTNALYGYQPRQTHYQVATLSAMVNVARTYAAAIPHILTPSAASVKEKKELPDDYKAAKEMQKQPKHARSASPFGKGEYDEKTREVHRKQIMAYAGRAPKALIDNMLSATRSKKYSIANILISLDEAAESDAGVEEDIKIDANGVIYIGGGRETTIDIMRSAISAKPRRNQAMFDALALLEHFGETSKGKIKGTLRDYNRYIQLEHYISGGQSKKKRSKSKGRSRSRSRAPRYSELPRARTGPQDGQFAPSGPPASQPSAAKQATPF